MAVAIDDHLGHEPFAIELSADRDPIEHNILLVPRFIASEPALLDPRIPAEIRLLRGKKLRRQRLSGAVPEFDFEPRFECRHHAIRCRCDWLKYGHLKPPVREHPPIEDNLWPAGGEMAVRAAAACGGTAKRRRRSRFCCAATNS